MAQGGNLDLENMCSLHVSDDIKHLLKLLPCYHTVCKYCLRSLLLALNVGNAEYPTTKCPQCRAQISIASPEQLPTNFYIQQFKAAVEEKLGGNRANIGSPCEKHSTLGKQCHKLECGICMYETHVQGHTILPVNDNSRQISDNIAEINSVSVQERSFLKALKDFIFESQYYIDFIDRQLSTCELKIGDFIELLKRNWTSSDVSIGSSQERISVITEAENMASKILELKTIFEDKSEEIVNLAERYVKH